MKVKLKTKKQLIKEGWVENTKSIYYFLSIDGKEPSQHERINYKPVQRHQTAYMHKHFVERFLGKTFEIVRIRSDHNGAVVGDIKVDEQDITISAEIVVGGLKVLKPRKTKKSRIFIDSNELVFNGQNFKVGCRSFDVVKGVRAAKWILKIADLQKKKCRA